MAKLTFVLEDGQQVVVPVDRRITVGSANGNDVVVEDERVAEQHAEIVVKRGRHELRDLNSKSGTMVNGARVERALLKHGDQVAFGPCAGLFETDDAPVKKTAKKSTARAAKRKPESEPEEARPEPLTRESAAAETAGLAAALDAARSAVKQETDRLEQLRAEVAAATARVEELRRQDTASDARLREAADELAAKNARLEKLEEEQAALAHVTEALRETRAKHEDWTEALRVLGEEHENKSVEVQKLGLAAEGMRREVETITAHRAETMGHLQQLHADRAALDAHLAELRQTAKEAEERDREMSALLETRKTELAEIGRKIADQEHERAQREAHIAGLAGVEERLSAAQSRLEEAARSHAGLSSAVEKHESTKRELEAAAAELRNTIAGHEARRDQTARDADSVRAEFEEISRRVAEVTREREQGEQGLSVVRADLDTARQQLEELTQKRAELDRQCQELAGTEEELSTKTAALVEARDRHAAIQSEISETERERARRRAILDDLIAEEESAKGRIEVLRGREHDLRGALEQLSVQERTDRDRIEEIHGLVTEMEQEHATRKAELAQATDATRRELADMELKLAPLRDWKDGMDRRYARLAALPEDSAEAREVWREIENEKASLRNLISSQAGQTRTVSLREAVLKNLSRPVDEGTGGAKEKLHAPEGMNLDATATPGERANVGPTGTGAMYSGAGQEMALKARLNRLRESVQREAVRLEFLRQERAREESRGRGLASDQPALREHDRQLETKIRRDEERHAALQRKLELAEVEEEKRREKVAELELRLAELRADITDADRQRSDLRHQSDLAHTELKNIEAAVERMKKKSE